MSASTPIPRINRLSSTLANQIAAGEVIERPASVVKELVENSLDAGASRILIDIAEAGSRLIRVTDNGHGIHPDDLVLALERHATGKLHSQSDLFAIKSLGFRGEALPSISSIADFTLTSRIAEREHASRLHIDTQTGQSELMPAAHPLGTTVEVSNLFHNTPARKKFLRSDRTEFLHIHETVRRLALSQFNFSLELRHNGQKILSSRLASENHKARLAGIIGQVFADRAIAVQQQAGDMHLWGWLGVEQLARSSSDRQYLYLNGRMIRDRRLNHAIRVACEGHIATGRFPAYVLYLEMDVTAVDVNVHPSKHEVRFHHATDVHDFLYAALLRSIQDASDLYPEGPAPTGDSPGADSSIKHGVSHPRRHNVVGEYRSTYSDLQGGRQMDLSNEIPELGGVLLQLDHRYILTQREQEVVLLDMEMARKYLAQHRLAAVDDGESIRARPLLVPITYEINHKQESVLAKIAVLLADYALQIELSGPGKCRLRSIPNLLENADLQALVMDLLDQKIKGLSDARLRQDLVQTMINHVGDIPNPAMTRTEMLMLLRQLQGTGLDLSQPHHPVIWTTIDEKDWQRLIKRNE